MTAVIPRFAFGTAILAVMVTSAGANATEPLRFNRDIRPILAENCYQCHGPDKAARKSGLRLDDREHALNPGESGAVAIVPGRPESSELVRRIFAADAAELMPPAESHKSLTATQKELLKEWISQGASYEKHWSFLPPVRAPLPNVKQSDWPRTAIDYFILARLEQEGLAPSAAADYATLLRRLTLDLTGLPPLPAEVDQFEREMSQAGADDAKTGSRDGNDRIYAKWVDKLLDSPHYGERMAIDWLDAARYADSNGYQVDRDRELYAYRDWVISAFNANMPFDQFTIEQIAGDLLPNPSFSQKVATGFHRNHMLNEEGGIIAEEFLAEYCCDRVETTAAVWLGQTFTCTRCHDHKYDPFSQRDYYGLYAYFHNINEQGIGDYGKGIRRNAPPFLKLSAPEIEAQLAPLEKERDELNKQLVAISDKNSTEHKSLSDQIAATTKKIDELDGQIPTTLIMEELPEPRKTYILIRGAYDKKGDEVTAATPQVLPPMPADWPKNRLGLARWLVSPENPLPARVIVSRLWQSRFGAGLVRTSEDFGTQGEPPTHPELLDWLAIEFQRTGWDVKAMLRLMVTSSTYRQSSKLTAALRERDPENRLLARGPRFRLQSEFLRDQALAASGLLARKIGGPSVKPYHPPGLYEQVVSGSGTNTWVVGQGDEIFRRSMYTYWKRSVPHPAMLLFDAPFRETCALRRPRTNTALQALNLMNDPTYVEAARALAERMKRDGGNSTNDRITTGFRLVLARKPNDEELSILTAAFERSQKAFASDPAGAAELLKIGTIPADPKQPAADLAAWTVVAMTIFNLDEAVTRQ